MGGRLICDVGVRLLPSVLIYSGKYYLAHTLITNLSFRLSFTSSGFAHCCWWVADASFFLFFFLGAFFLMLHVFLMLAILNPHLCVCLICGLRFLEVAVRADLCVCLIYDEFFVLGV